MRRTSRFAPVALGVAALLLGVLPAQAQAHPDRAPDRVTIGDRTFTTDGQGPRAAVARLQPRRQEQPGRRGVRRHPRERLKDMAARGFNLARLAFFWDDLEPTPGHYDRGYLAKMRRILDWAGRYRVKVVLDAHQDVYGPHFGSRGVPAWATRDEGLPFRPIPEDWFSEYFEPSVQAAFDHLYKDTDLRTAHARMWTTVASALGGHPALLGYDLMNEPFARILEGEDLPAAAARFEAGELTEMWNRLARAVRLVDRKSWVFVEPTVIVGLGARTRMGHIDDRTPGTRRTSTRPRWRPAVTTTPMAPSSRPTRRRSATTRPVTACR
ncbi:glycoside hydrolase family 5 protein [Streptomyces cirratus]